jgi:hypothetical protein
MATGTVTADQEIGYKTRAILEPLYRIGLAPHNGFTSGTITITFSGGVITTIVYGTTLDQGSNAWNPPSAVIT